MRWVKACAFLVSLLVVWSAPAWAVNPDEVLDDPALEQRARDISIGLRCLVCQNQSIDDSDAELAKDLRVLVRQRLSEGDSDEEVIDYVVSRYGEFVLLKPRFTAQTLLLWGTPLIILILGSIYIVVGRSSRPAGQTKLTDEEHAELEKFYIRVIVIADTFTATVLEPKQFEGASHGVDIHQGTI